MTPDAYAAALHRAGMPQGLRLNEVDEWAVKHLEQRTGGKISKRTARGYRQGQQSIPRWVELALNGTRGTKAPPADNKEPAP